MSTIRDSEAGTMNRRILVIDDNEGIHADFRKILTPVPLASDDLLATEAELFGTPVPSEERVHFELVTACQGKDGHRLATEAAAAGKPFAVAFVDMRMPPGWDGLETIQRIWADVPEIEIVICTAFSDYSWEETVRRLGRTDRLLIVKKPFDHVEVLQVASALTHKWNLQQQARQTLSHLTDLVRDRTKELERARDNLLALNSDLVGARDAAEAANRSKTIFLANISHELRTPMTAIIGYTEELQTHFSDLPEVAPEVQALETIRRNAEHLVTIISDLLDMSKIEAGKLCVEPAAMNPLRVVDEVIALLQPKAAAKHLPLTCEYATPMPSRIVTDALRFRQILVNLVDNAIKFTTAGNVRVVLRHEPMPRSMLVVDVVDAGVGIAPDSLQRLFRPFEQADPSTTRRFGGTGLGLAISRQLAQLLGGDITVESTVGKGTRFSVHIPTGPLDGVPLETGSSGEPPRAPNQREDRSVPSLAGTRVLIVEDGRDNQLLFTRILERAGCRTEVVSDGAVCVERLADPSRPVDIVLMDVQMPVMDGITATRLLRSRGCTTPIVALTANAMANDLRACEVAGCNAVLTKPIDRRVLIETLRRVCV